MTVDDVRRFLTDRGTAFEEGDVQHGTRFRCKTGEILTVYQTGRMSFQGKETALSEELRAVCDGATPAATRTTAAPTASPAATSKPVFVVYGHDTDANRDLELLIHRMDLEPVLLQNLTAQGDTLIEKLERYFGDDHHIGFACVLLTPDDEGHVKGQETEKRYRARQNVILELGMALARLGRRNVAILHKQSVELPSDIDGLIYLPFQERVDEVKAKLYQELRAAGYNPNDSVLG